MSTLYVNEDWTQSNGTINSPSYGELTIGTNAFKTATLAAGKANDNDIIFLLSASELLLNTETNYNSFIIESASVDYKLTLKGKKNGNGQVTINCPVTIAAGTSCEYTNSKGITVNGALVVNGSLACGSNTLTANAPITVSGSIACDTLDGQASISVSGENASLTVEDYKGGALTVEGGASLTVTGTYSGGALTVGDGATLTIDEYSGGAITLTGNATLNIESFGDEPPVINFPEPEVGEARIPYTKILSISGYTKTDYEDLSCYNPNQMQVIKVSNADALYYAPIDYKYVNTNYSANSKPDVLTFGTTGFASVSDALDESPTKIFVTGGTFGTEGTIVFKGTAAEIGNIVTGNADINETNSTPAFTKSVVAGDKFAAGATLSGNTELTINDGTFSKVVVGGDYVTATGSKMVTRYGKIALTINGGTFATTVGGGMAYTKDDKTSKVNLVGDIDFKITGGEFARRVYGGSICNIGKGTTITVDGNVELTIGSTVNDIKFAEHIVAGCFDSGSVTGSTTITFTGLGEKLKNGEGNAIFDGIVLGGSGSTYFTKDEQNNRICKSEVDGNRNIVFDGFTGEFAGQLKAFTNASFESSTVTFTNASLNLSDVSAWSFANGATVAADTDTGTNSFAGDTLAIDLTGWDGSEDWTLMTGSSSFFTGVDQLSVKFGTGDADAIACSNDAWSDGNYTLQKITQGDAVVGLKLLAVRS